MNIDRMTLENESDSKPTITNHHSKAISCIIAWLPGLTFEQLMETLTTIQHKVDENVDAEIFTEYLAEQREVETGDLTAPAYLQFIIQNSIKKSLSQINDLEGENSGLDALCDQLMDENTALKKENEKAQATIDKLTIQMLACMSILELCSEKESNLTHVERNALARVGKEILYKLFPDGVGTKRPVYEDF